MARRRVEVPADPPRCEKCGKVAGKFKGFAGAECMCDQPKGKPYRMHSTLGQPPYR